jgi:hypothetical protein
MGDPAAVARHLKRVKELKPKWEEERRREDAELEARFNNARYRGLSLSQYDKWEKDQQSWAETCEKEGWSTHRNGSGFHNY